MLSGISLTLSASDRLQLEALVADRNTPQMSAGVEYSLIVGIENSLIGARA
jgi:hypothetical protein